MAAMRAVTMMVTIAALLHVAMATSYTVGGPNGGWDLSTDLQMWALSQRFTPGDNLLFTYSSSHDVLEVTKADYEACSATSPMESHTGGNTAVKLSAPGKRYFICGVPGHCAAGMKLQVNVISISAEAPTPSLKSPPSAMSAPPKHHHHHHPHPAPKSTSHSPSKAPMVARAKAPSTSVSPISYAPGMAPSKTSRAHGCSQRAKVALGLAMGFLMALAV